MNNKGVLPSALPTADILRQDAVNEAFREVSGRPELKPALEIALAAQDKYGF